MMQFDEGSILRRKCPFPLITHVGILLYNEEGPTVYHNTAIKKNEFGGNIVAMPLEEFLSIGDLISSTPCSIDPNFVRAFAHELRFKKYNALFYNCEDFINDILFGKKGSRQRRKWMTIFGVSTISAIFSLKKRKNNLSE